MCPRSTHVCTKLLSRTIDRHFSYSCSIERFHLSSFIFIRTIFYRLEDPFLVSFLCPPTPILLHHYHHTLHPNVAHACFFFFLILVFFVLLALDQRHVWYIFLYDDHAVNFPPWYLFFAPWSKSLCFFRIGRQ
jgi:hypothetical protein